jgi:hypothetical protein
MPRCGQPAATGDNAGCSARRVLTGPHAIEGRGSSLVAWAVEDEREPVPLPAGQGWRLPDQPGDVGVNVQGASLASCPALCVPPGHGGVGPPYMGGAGRLERARDGGVQTRAGHARPRFRAHHNPEPRMTSHSSRMVQRYPRFRGRRQTKNSLAGSDTKHHTTPQHGTALNQPRHNKVSKNQIHDTRSGNHIARHNLASPDSTKPYQSARHPRHEAGAPCSPALIAAVHSPSVGWPHRLPAWRHTAARQPTRLDSNSSSGVGVALPVTRQGRLGAPFQLQPMKPTEA